MVTAGTYQPFESVYRNYLSGLVDPYARVGAAQMAPQAQMAYWTSPAAAGYQAPTGAGTNPFASFLGGGLGTGGGGAYSPLDAAGWMQRAGAVQTGLERTIDPASTTPEDIAALQMQGRFGMGGEDPAAAAANQARLVNQAVLAQTPMALRGETQGILQRLFDQWQGAPGSTGSYLQNRANVWGGFGL